MTGATRGAGNAHFQEHMNFDFTYSLYIVIAEFVSRRSMFME